MKHGSLKLILQTILLTFLSIGCTQAQDSIELPEIKGAHILEYKDLKIEITGVQRMRAYQPYWYKSDRTRGSKIIAKDGFEIALLRIHTTRLGTSRGIKINHVYLFDSSGKRYEGDLVSIFFLGARSDSDLDPKEHDYEFPVLIAQGTAITAVQIQQFVANETRPFFVFQNLFFDVAKFGW